MATCELSKRQAEAPCVMLVRAQPQQKGIIE